MATIISSLYGHRLGVITNMNLKEVAWAKQEGSPEEGYIINVSDHKKAHVFGSTQLFLLPEEFSWLEQWVALRPRVKPKAQTDLVFFTEGKGPMKNLNGNFQKAWTEMWLPASPPLPTCGYVSHTISPPVVQKRAHRKPGSPKRVAEKPQVSARHNILLCAFLPLPSV